MTPVAALVRWLRPPWRDPARYDGPLRVETVVVGGVPRTIGVVPVPMPFRFGHTPWNHWLPSAFAALDQRANRMLLLRGGYRESYEKAGRLSPVAWCQLAAVEQFGWICGGAHPRSFTLPVVRLVANEGMPVDYWLSSGDHVAALERAMLARPDGWHRSIEQIDDYIGSDLWIRSRPEDRP